MGESNEGAAAPEKAGGSSPVTVFAIFFFALVLTRLGIGELMPPPDSFREKLLYFSEHKDEFDLVFFGASDTHWGLAPEVFDARLRAHGLNVKSFNLGVPGMNGYEIDHLIRRVLEMEPARLEYAVIAWRPWRLETRAEINQREVWWHSLAETLVLFRGLWIDELALPEKLGFAHKHGKLALQKFLHLGLGPELIDFWKNPPGPGQGKWDYLAASGGFEALAPGNAERFWPEGPIKRQQFLEGLDVFRARTREQAELVRELESQDREPVPDYLATLYPRTVYSTVLQVEQLRARGVEPIYLIPPSHAHDKIQRRLAVEGYLPTLLDFNNPRRFPGLFEIQYRYDDEHFTAEGSAIYTRRVADAVAAVLEDSPSTVSPDAF